MRIDYPLALIAALCVLACLSTPLYPLFREVYDRSRALSISEEVEELLGLKGTYARLTFFELKGESVCAFYASGATGSMDPLRGKEWVVRLYDGRALVYEIRIDAALGFNSLYVNSSYTSEKRALNVAIGLLDEARPAVFRVENEGGVNVTYYQRTPPACDRALSESKRWRGVTAIVRVVFQALLLTSLILAAATAAGGQFKLRLALVLLASLLAIGGLRSLLSLPYRLGKAGAPPSLRALLGILYTDFLYGFFASSALVAGLSFASRRGGGLTSPDLRRTLESWTFGVLLGLSLLALSRLLYLAFYRLWCLLPLGIPVLEEALSSRLAWLELSLSSAASAIGEEVVFRLFILTLLVELLRSVPQAVVLSSALFSLLHAAYPLYPVQAKLIQAFLLGLILAASYLRRGLLPVVIAHYTLNAVSAALAIYPLRPIDAQLLIVTVPLSLPAAILAGEVGRYATGTS